MSQTSSVSQVTVPADFLHRGIPRARSNLMQNCTPFVPLSPFVTVRCDHFNRHLGRSRWYKFSKKLKITVFQCYTAVIDVNCEIRVDAVDFTNMRQMVTPVNLVIPHVFCSTSSQTRIKFVQKLQFVEHKNFLTSAWKATLIVFWIILQSLQRRWFWPSCPRPTCFNVTLRTCPDFLLQINTLFLRYSYLFFLPSSHHSTSRRCPHYFHTVLLDLLFGL